MIVYLVKQKQPSSDYFDTTIYVCSTKERAIEYCRKLNKEYGKNCVFDENWDFVDENIDGDPHYYTWVGMEIDEPLA